MPDGGAPLPTGIEFEILMVDDDTTDGTRDLLLGLVRLAGSQLQVFE